MSVSTQQITLVKMCGTESAQVLASYLPRLLQQAAPGATLQTTAETGSRHGEAALLGVIVLLPAEPSLRRSAWYRFNAHAPFDVPVLPVVVGNQEAFAEHTRSTAEEFTTELPQSRNRKPATGGLGGAFRGLSVLPAIRVADDDARIEHGGHFHLEREVARDLEARLKSLVDLSRSAFVGKNASKALHVKCACAPRVTTPAPLSAP